MVLRAADAIAAISSQFLKHLQRAISMFGIYILIILFVMIPLSISAGNRIKRGAPLNKVQLHFFVNLDIVQAALGKHYQAFWWTWWVVVSILALMVDAWAGPIVFGIYIWSRLRFQKLSARPAVAVEASP